ncbi:MAG: hypothetical protein QOH03_179, partial [Kribbellaceae bacterium]|nr:hypothetical protein [Kribbellaceae bacterium]
MPPPGPISINLSVTPGRTADYLLSS